MKNRKIERLKRIALKGDVDAQCCLGVRFYHGQGVEKDYKEARKWLKLAAEQGHANAKSCLFCLQITRWLNQEPS